MARPLYLAAFAILLLANIALVVFTILFFSSPGVLPQLQAWASQVTPGRIALRAVGDAFEPPPRPTLARPLDLSAVLPTPTRTPFQPLLDSPEIVAVTGAEPAATPEPAPATALPTQPRPTPIPIYQVLEEQPPQGHLVVPSLGLDQPLTPVAVRETEWDLANLNAQVGWLQTTGSHPGDDLAMVVIGHITVPGGGSGPFLRLKNLEPGDVVEYRTSEATYVYLVTAKSVVNPQQVDTLYRQDGNRLLMVTCTSYNTLARQYDQRLLVEAELMVVEN